MKKVITTTSILFLGCPIAKADFNFNADDMLFKISAFTILPVTFILSSLRRISNS